jgi:hypothetical protein
MRWRTGVSRQPRGSHSMRDTWPRFSSPACWHRATTSWRTGIRAVSQALSQETFIQALPPWIPECRLQDVTRPDPEFRAQAATRDGSLVAEVRLVETGWIVSGLNASSLGATVVISRGMTMAEMAANHGMWL